MRIAQELNTLPHSYFYIIFLSRLDRHQYFYFAYLKYFNVTMISCSGRESKKPQCCWNNNFILIFVAIDYVSGVDSVNIIINLSWFSSLLALEVVYCRSLQLHENSFCYLTVKCLYFTKHSSSLAETVMKKRKKKKKGLILDYEHCCRWQELGGNKICGKRRNAEMTRKAWCSWEKGTEGR